MHDIVDDIIKIALEEDVGQGDVTSMLTVPPDKGAKGAFTAKEAGVICGLDIARRVFEAVDSSVSFTSDYKDGDKVKRGDVVARVEGNALALLAAERVALNLMQRLSGIATRTAEAVAAVAGTKARITDTRKTTPGIRALEKYAVRAGGGVNHRFSLADGILIKDNHIDAAGGITATVKKARAGAPHTLKIEVEAETLEQVREALEAGADIIMFDNMSVEDMKKAAEMSSGRALTEASGNMGDRDAEGLLEVARTGVDIISIGALTHTVHSLDISLKIK